MTVVAPMVSQACILRTRLLVLSMARMEYASERVTAIGRPSGTATTMSVTATMSVCSVWASRVDQVVLSAPGLMSAKAPHTIAKNSTKKPTMVRMHLVRDQSSNFLITRKKNSATGIISSHAGHWPHPMKWMSWATIITPAKM